MWQQGVPHQYCANGGLRWAASCFWDPNPQWLQGKLWRPESALQVCALNTVIHICCPKALKSTLAYLYNFVEPALHKILRLNTGAAC